MSFHTSSMVLLLIVGGMRTEGFEEREDFEEEEDDTMLLLLLLWSARLFFLWCLSCSKSRMTSDEVCSKRRRDALVQGEDKLSYLWQ